jgi:hypothetical protein
MGVVDEMAVVENGGGGGVEDMPVVSAGARRRGRVASFSIKLSTMDESMYGQAYGMW